ncbi:MAG: aldo/keto reductase [Bacteroidales bacterium]|nr:aldo/keto reductase [Bacteroidales bacterium]
MNRLNRRKFLKSALVGASGLVTAPAILNAKNSKSNISNNLRKEQTLIKRKLGNTGLELPIVSFGVMRSDSSNLAKAAIEKGITHFDTAHYYQDGKNEEMLGNVFKNYSRDSLIVATKVLPEDYYLDPRYEKITSASTKEKFIERFEISLKRLQMDYVDILYLHAMRSYEDTLNESMMEALTELKKQGKCRFIGVSTHSHEHDVIQAAIDSKTYDVVLTAINFNKKNINEITDKIALANENGLGIVGMKTMAGGYWDKERKHPINCKAALKWVLQNEHVHTTIPGIVSFDQLDENLSVMENLEMTEEEKASLNPPEGLEAGLYCSGCRQCIPQCPKKLPIPDISRAYMYAYGYKELAKSRQLIEELNYDEKACDECTICIVNCPHGFNVREKIADISRIKIAPKEMLT